MVVVGVFVRVRLSLEVEDSSWREDDAEHNLMLWLMMVEGMLSRV